MAASPEWSDPRFPLTKKTRDHQYTFTEQERQASVYHPPHDLCCICQDSFYRVEEQSACYPRFTYRGEVFRQEAERIATDYTENAQRDRDALWELLRDHGDRLVSKWRKKTSAKRAAIFTAVSPELNQEDWVFALYNRISECWEAGRDPIARVQLLLPWLTLSILKTKPSALFALLYHRTAAAPHEWAPYDNKQLTFSWSSGHFDVHFTSLCVVMHGPSYGREIVDFDLDSIHRQDIIGFPRARLVLEAQAYLMRFLRNTVESVLGALGSPAGSQKWLTVSIAGLKHAGEDLGCRSTYAYQAYSRPPKFEASSLILICEVQINALEGHLTFLQTDLQYIKRNLHTFEQGKMYERMSDAMKGLTLYTAAYKDVITFWRWKWLKAECEHVKSLQDRFRDSTDQGQPLPEKYEKALGALELFLAKLVDWRADDLRVHLIRRLGLPSHFVYSSRKGVARVDVSLKCPRTSPRALYEQAPLYWCLSEMARDMNFPLAGDVKSQTRHDSCRLLAFFEQHLDTCSAQDRERVDDQILRAVSDLVAYSEMLMNVQLHRPLYRAGKVRETIAPENRNAWKAWEASKGFKLEFSLDMWKEMGNLVYETMKSSYFQGGNEMTRLTQVKDMRARTEKFWAETRKGVTAYFRDTRFTASEISSLIGVISANLSPRYLSEVKREENRISGTPKSNLKRVEVQTEWGMSQTQAEDSSVRTLRQTPKIKTRPNGSTLPEAPEVVETVTEAETDHKTIPVPKRSLQVLHLMYPADAEERRKGVDWRTFVRTMADAGFEAHDVGGSTVSFVSDAGKINFDKHHPDSHVDAESLRRFAWRMTKWFGWGRESFVLRA